MSLSARLTTPPPRSTGGHPCSVGDLRQGLPSEDQAALDRMIWELGWSDRQIYAVLIDDEHTVSFTAIGKHRRRTCRCDSRFGA